MQNATKIQCEAKPVVVEVFGASDDLIELRGAVTEEFGASASGNYLQFSDGTVLYIYYGKEIGGVERGIWSIEVCQRGRADVHIKGCIDEDATPYSDVATLKGIIPGVACWDSFPPSYEELVLSLRELDWGDLDREILNDVYESLTGIYPDLK